MVHHKHIIATAMIIVRIMICSLVILSLQKPKSMSISMNGMLIADAQNSKFDPPDP
jgi:hypothetical protein